MKKKLLTLLCVLCLAASLTVPVMAAEVDSYTYTVRVFAGANGTIGGSDVWTATDLALNETVSFSPAQVNVTNGKYYAKGVRLSGSDSSSGSYQTSLSGVAVTGDEDYVVVYGLEATRVAYTVSYQDADGNNLLDSQTFYGNVGDRPVVAYQYIEGYQPQAYNLTRTLTDNAAENVFTFVYSLPPVTVVPAEEEPAAETTADADADADAAAADATIDEDAVPLDQGPADLIDLDEDSVPLTNGAFQDIGEAALQLNAMPIAAKIGIASAVMLLLGCLGWILLHNNKKKVEAND